MHLGERVALEGGRRSREHGERGGEDRCGVGGHGTGASEVSRNPKRWVWTGRSGNVPATLDTTFVDIYDDTTIRSEVALGRPDGEPWFVSTTGGKTHRGTASCAPTGSLGGLTGQRGGRPPDAAADRPLRRDLASQFFQLNLVAVRSALTWTGYTGIRGDGNARPAGAAG